MDSDTTKGILQMIGTLLEICIGCSGNNQVEMAIDQLFVLSRYQFFNLL